MNDEDLAVIKGFDDSYRKLVNSIGDLNELAKNANDLPIKILLRDFLYYESHYPRFHKITKILSAENNKGADYVLYRFDDSIIKIEVAKIKHSKLAHYRYLSQFLDVLSSFISACEIFLQRVFTISPSILLEIESAYRENKWHLFQSLGRKNAVILHGGFETPNSYWYPSIAGFLKNNRFEVWTPQIPYLNQTPDLRVQLPFVLQNGNFNEHTTIVAHSAGCPLTLSVLENLNVRIHRAVLVAGFVEGDDFPSTILQRRYNWEKIRKNVEDIIFINSDDDPWGCNQAQGKLMFYSLVSGGALVILHGQGHFGSGTYNQPYREFPFLERVLSLP